MALKKNHQKNNSPKKNDAASSTRSIQLLLPRQSGGATVSTKEQAYSKGNPTGQFPIVGIGASAGGLAAFEAFFSGMPAEADPDMAFVVVQHLAPDHKSILTGLIQRSTRMQVSEVEDGMKVLPNCAYIIPPGKDMAFEDGSLRLLEPAAPRGQRLPIDFFFRSLARDQRERAICIVLSGTGSDGTLGVRAIKGEGGMAMAQTPGSTEYDGMPKSAIATGLIDYELPPAEMAVKLMDYAAHAFNDSDIHSSPTTKDENIRKTIFNVLQKETGHDFSQYKPSTIARRLTRRMVVHQIETLEGYADYLRRTPIEVAALFSDLLIGVTSFFRDPEAFTALEKKVIPKLFVDRSAGDTVRVWSQGCSTGEEAYSLAILMQEHLNTLKQNYMVQIFATDIDGRAIATARAGLYPANIAADVSPERLSRFFSIEDNNTTYRIHKGIRDMVIFSEQDVIKDPPFSKLDLLCCRNLLIYMTSNLQKRIIPLFHYALKPGGFLLLGSSENAGDCDDMFAVFDKKSKLYRRKQGLNSVYRTAQGQGSTTAIEDKSQPLPAWKRTGLGKLSLRELTEQALLQQVAPTGALVNARGDILYLHGRTGMYLEPTPGEAAVNNILEMAREGLRHEMASALHQASAAQETVRRPGLLVNGNGAFITVNLSISPMITGPTTSADVPLYLVILEEVVTSGPANTTAGADGSTLSPDMDASVYIASLRQELRAKEQFLQIANEELKSTVEEMQSINEELQSTNEELETSKEELQSTNEELATVNAELQSNVVDLTRANNDMNNMVAGTGIGTVFVDHRLRILRFTPDLTRIINLIQTDVGRPIGHIVSNMTDDHLVADVQAVLDSLVPMEKDVQTIEEMWYTMRIHPYRTINNAIEGAVISFIDITKRRRAEDALKKAFDEIRTLRGIIPICAKCKQIRDDKGFWSQVEVYIKDHTEAEFSHAICPECAKDLYPEFSQAVENPGDPS